MMKGAEDREDTIALSSNDYPNGQIRKSETLNGASNSIKKMLEVTKSSLSFDMTVKKVTIPPQWETLSFGSSNDNHQVQNKDLTNGLSCNGTSSEEDLCEDTERASTGSIILDFVDDSEKFGLSDSEVDKLLADVEDKEEEEEEELEMSKSDDKERNGTNLESDTSNKTKTAGVVGDTCGSSNEPNSIPATTVNCENDQQSDSDQLNTEVSKEHPDDSDHLKPATETSVDCNMGISADVVTDGVGEDIANSVKPLVTDSEKSVKTQEEICAVLESSSCSNNNFETSESCVDPSSEVVNHKHTADHKLEDDKSSHSVCDEHQNENKEGGDILLQLLSEKASNEDDASFSQNNSVNFNKESHDSDASPSNEVRQNNISPEIEDNCAELSDAEMQVDHFESSEKSVNMEMENDDIEQNESVRDNEIQSNHSDQNSDSEDIVVEDHGIGNSDPMETCNDETDSSEKSSVQMEVNDCSEQEEKLPCTASQPAADIQAVSSEKTTAGKSSDSEVVPVRNFIRVKNSSELQAVSVDNQGKATELDKQSMVDKDSFLKNTAEVKKPDSICDKNERCITEDTVCNKEVEKLVRKRSSSVDSDVARENKRTKVETSGNKTFESTSGCDEGDSTLRCEKSEKTVESVTREVEVIKNKNSEEGERLELSSENCETSTEENNKAVENSDKKKNDADKEKCDAEEEKQDQVKGGESSSASKRAHEQIGLIEVKKVRFTLEMEKQLKLVEQKLISVSGSSSDSDGNKEPEKSVSAGSKEPEKSVSAESKGPGKSVSAESKGPGKSISAESKGPGKSISEGNKASGKPFNEGNKEPEKSFPPSEPKTNLDLAIERVVAGITDDPESPEDSEEHMDSRKLNPMPFIKDLHQNLLKKLSRNDLEEFVMQKLCEVVTERCTLGEVRQRCQSLEQMLDQWRRKAQQLQKQLKDMEMVMKRYIGDARLRKERPMPVKITRSVGLQVHMGALGPGMLRNRNLGDPGSRTPSQIRRRINRTSPPPPPSAGTPTQQQQQKQQQQQTQSPQQQQPPAQQQQQRQIQPVVRTPSNPLTVQKVVTPGFTKVTTSTPSISQTIVPRPPLTTLVASTPTKIAPAPVKPVIARPTIVTAAIGGTITTGSTTSTVNTVNSTVVNTTNNLRITSASQLNNRQQPKTATIYTPTKTGADHKVIDLTDEEDKAKATMGVVRPIIPTSATLTANLVSTNNTTTNIAISSSPNIQTGSIRVVQPHQLTGSTTTAILAPSASASAASRVAYFVPTTGGAVQQRQVLIATTSSQVRPGVVTMSSRQTQLPTFLFKGGTVVPIQQASGTGPMNSATIIRSCPPVQTNSLQQVLNPARPGQQIRVPSSLVQAAGRMATPTLTSVATALVNKHPAPLPNPPVYQPSNVNWKCAPPKPELKISKVANKNQQGIVLSWNMTLTSEYEEIASYQLYAYQEGSAQPSTSLWKKVGDVKALPLPMACTLTQFMEGHKYHFAVRAVDVHTRVGPFSTPGNIVLTRK